MKNFDNKYILKFAVVMVVIVASVLSLAATLLDPIQEKNKVIEKKQNILASIHIKGPKSQTDELYKKYITSAYTINESGERNEGDAFMVNIKEEFAEKNEEKNLPVYEGTSKEGKKSYIFPVYGKGLWGPIWGYIALEENFKTIEGVFFDHQKETPGLGAEITNPDFKKQFEKLKLFDNNQFTSIEVKKGQITKPEYQVESISGATVTSYGIENMITESLDYYLEFIKKEKRK